MLPIPGQGTRSYMPQLEIPHAARNIEDATTKTRHSWMKFFNSVSELPQPPQVWQLIKHSHKIQLQFLVKANVYDSKICRAKASRKKMYIGRFQRTNAGFCIYSFHNYTGHALSLIHTHQTIDICGISLPKESCLSFRVWVFCGGELVIS